MGCSADDSRCDGDEYPSHAVTISLAFELMTTEATVGMLRATGSAVPEQPDWSTSPDQPVVIVNWDESRAFCEALGGRLPTEAEWEYAARGELDGAVFPWGSDDPSYDDGDATGATFEGGVARPVGSFGANGYGLYDMAGTSGNGWPPCTLATRTRPSPTRPARPPASYAACGAAPTATTRATYACRTAIPSIPPASTSISGSGAHATSSPCAPRLLARQILFVPHPPPPRPLPQGHGEGDARQQHRQHPHGRAAREGRDPGGPPAVRLPARAAASPGVLPVYCANARANGTSRATSPAIAPGASAP